MVNTNIESFIPQSGRSLKFSLRELFLMIFIGVSGVPIVVFGDFPLSLSDITIVILLGIYLIFAKGCVFSPHIKYILLAAAISFCLILLVTIFGINNDFFQMFLSWGNFFKCVFAYAFGNVIIRSYNDIGKYCRGTFLLLSSTYLICMVYDHNIFLNNGLSFYNIALYGTKGINAGFVYLTTSMILYLVFSNGEKRRSVSNILSNILLLITIAMIFYSSSRQAILGCVLFLYFYCSTRLLRGIILLLLMLILLQAVGLPDYFVAKMSIKFDSLYKFEFDSFSAGRLGIYKIMVKNIMEHPWIGNVFSGFTSDVYLYLSNDRNSGLSPHNQYLGALWKMGLIAFIPYCVFLLKVYCDFRRQYCINKNTTTKLLYRYCMIAYLIFFNTQDYLLFSLTGNMFMFIGGGLASILYENQLKVYNS